MKKILKNSGKKNYTSKIADRASLVYILFSLILAVEVIFLFYSAGVFANEKAASYREDAITQANKDTIIKGDIYDINGTVLVSSEEAGKPSSYIDSYAYSQIIGYSTSKRHYRLMELYEPELYKTTLNGKKGCSITLTLDHNVQMKAYELLKNQVGNTGTGSVIVMDVKTGEIKAFVSLPSFNANNLAESIPKQDAEYILSHPIAYKNWAAPGSIFKIITSVTLLENGYDDYTVQDTGVYTLPNGKTIANYHSNAYGELNYYSALEHSSNYYYISAMLSMENGSEKLTQTAKKFLIGENIELDFGNVDKSNWSLAGNDANELAYTSFGQGKTLFSTMNAVIEAEAIANDGVVMKPYMIKDIVSEHHHTVQEGSPQVLQEVTSKEVADKITQAMLASSDYHKINPAYQIASKTGTAETGKGDYHAWMVSFAPADNPQYVVVVNQLHTKQDGVTLAPILEKVYEYLLGFH